MPKTQPKRKAQSRKPARKSAVAKANKRKTEKAVGANRKTFLQLVHDDMMKVAAGVEEKLSVLGSELFSNQKALEQSHLRLDDQFAVLTRIVISTMNDLTSRTNQMAMAIMELAQKTGIDREAPSHVKDVVCTGMPNLITYEDVNKAFHEYDEFKKRPDFRDHFRAWYTGEDMSKLPPPAAVEAKTEDKKLSTLGESADFPKGAQIFGGDYAKSSDGDVNAGTDSADAEADEVSKVPEAHGDGAEPDEREGAGAVL